MFIGVEWDAGRRGGKLVEPYLSGRTEAANFLGDRFREPRAKPLGGQAEQNGLELSKLRRVQTAPALPKALVLGQGVEHRSNFVHVVRAEAAAQEMPQGVQSRVAEGISGIEHR